MESLRSFVDAAEAFGARLTDVEAVPLALAIAFSLVNLGLRARAWQNILRAAYPSAGVRYRDALGPYLAGAGVNAAVPARVGDLVRIFLLRRRVRPATWPGSAASLVVETALDWVLAAGLLLWALQAGVLPGLPRLPRLPAFDLSWAARNPLLALGMGLAFGALVIVGAFYVQTFRRRFTEGLAILRTPRRYLTGVVAWQLAAFVARVAGAGFFLAAFGVPATIQAALVVQVAGAVSSLFPATPGGLGPKQALLVVMLAGTAGRADVLAFSVGMELTLTAVSLVIGLVAVAALTGGLRPGRLLRDARDSHAATRPPGAAG